ncbi:MAG: DUF4926 domain-containing protein [Gammaproteobacteria bacterium]|nr:DUF4926 domain-containing protein [Gammaproteobacteria bacterium]
MNFKINDTVRLLTDIPGEGLAKGALGVVVAEFSEPEEAYEIEFSDADGETVAQIALLPTQIGLVR